MTGSEEGDQDGEPIIQETVNKAKPVSVGKESKEVAPGKVAGPNDTKQEEGHAEFAKVGKVSKEAGTDKVKNNVTTHTDARQEVGHALQETERTKQAEEENKPVVETKTLVGNSH
jgi:hypothetical protein